MEKVNKELRRQLTDIIQKEIDDPDVEFLSITRVETTSDLQESKVYFSLLDDSKYPKVKQILEEMKGYIRGILGKKIRLKILPHLNFISDESIKYSVDIYQKIEEIKNKDKDDEEDLTKEDN
jgi:ribosome-binding factor A